MCVKSWPAAAAVNIASVGWGRCQGVGVLVCVLLRGNNNNILTACYAFHRVLTMGIGRENNNILWGINRQYVRFR